MHRQDREYQRHSAPEPRASSLRERSQEAIARRGREQLEIEQRQEIDGAELAVPGRRRGNARADGQVGLQQLGDLDRSLIAEFATDRFLARPAAVRARLPARWGRRKLAVGIVSNSGETL